MLFILNPFNLITILCSLQQLFIFMMMIMHLKCAPVIPSNDQKYTNELEKYCEIKIFFNIDEIRL